MVHYCFICQHRNSGDEKFSSGYFILIFPQWAEAKREAFCKKNVFDSLGNFSLDRNSHSDCLSFAQRLAPSECNQIQHLGSSPISAFIFLLVEFVQKARFKTGSLWFYMNPHVSNTFLWVEWVVMCPNSRLSWQLEWMSASLCFWQENTVKYKNWAQDFNKKSQIIV